MSAALHAPHWEPAAAPSGAAGPWAVAGPTELTTGLDAPGFVVDSYADPAALAELLAAWRPAATRLVVLTHGAVAAGGYAPTPDRAAAWGVARAHQLRHPGQVVLVDADQVTATAVATAVAAGEDQLALRGGHLLRLAHTEVRPATPPPFTGPVVLTGHNHDDVARHLTDTHGVHPMVAPPAKVPELTAEPGATVVCVHLSADTAAALHEATLASQLAGFVLLTSDVTTGAVNDALARHRHLLGVPGVSVTHAAAHLAGCLDTALATNEPCLTGSPRATSRSRRRHERPAPASRPKSPSR